MRRRGTRAVARDFDAPGLQPKLDFDPADDIAAPFIAHRRAAARGDPARAGRQRPGRDGVGVHARRLQRVRRAHERPDRRPRRARPISRASPPAAASATATCSAPAAAGRRRSWNATRCAMHSRHSSRASDSFALGVCNGCQMLAQLKDDHSRRRALADVPAQPQRAVRGAPGPARSASSRHRCSSAAWPARASRWRSRMARAAPSSHTPLDRAAARVVAALRRRRRQRRRRATRPTRTARPTRIAGLDQRRRPRRRS